MGKRSFLFDLHIQNAELKFRLMISDFFYRLAIGALRIEIMPGVFDGCFVTPLTQQVDRRRFTGTWPSRYYIPTCSALSVICHLTSAIYAWPFRRETKPQEQCAHLPHFGVPGSLIFYFDLRPAG